MLSTKSHLLHIFHKNIFTKYQVNKNKNFVSYYYRIKRHLLDIHLIRILLTVKNSLIFFSDAKASLPRNIENSEIGNCLIKNVIRFTPRVTGRILNFFLHIKLRLNSTNIGFLLQIYFLLYTH